MVSRMVRMMPLPQSVEIRERIALGSARAPYLHGHNKPNMLDAKIIHRDVKAANIFLNEEFEAVVGGFWIAKLMDCQDSHVDTADSPMERPKMSEVIRVLEGDNLAERWEQLEHEIVCNQFNIYHQNLDRTIADSIINPLPEELSGPR
ncbi:hypothetical protein RJ639_035357 [Escallonia herrerae]|uniref:non-specific serine/threonine protein kinase n=1 Tax=Escallonia herrerae TaxID=1293975 RepID=A0AA89B7N6_9ASTE|nr:hypothetical protein RJ639_035357 [Escallonia herrerae]